MNSRSARLEALRQARTTLRGIELAAKAAATTTCEARQVFWLKQQARANHIIRIMDSLAHDLEIRTAEHVVQELANE